MRATIRVRAFALVAIGALAGAAFAASASATPATPPTPVTGVGTLACHTAGRVTFNPPLATGGTATTETVTLKANLVHCTGTGDGATVRTGKATATVTLATNDCSVLATLTSGTLSTAVVWKTTMGSAPLTDSTVDFTAGTLGTSASGKGTLSLTGSATAGSFSGDAASANVTASRSVASIGMGCAHGTLRGLTFNSARSTASLG